MQTLLRLDTVVSTHRVLSNSSSFSTSLLSISWRMPVISIWARCTLASSCSKAPSASSRADCSSSFSISRRLRLLSSSWTLRPPSPSWSVRSWISSAKNNHCYNLTTFVAGMHHLLNIFYVEQGPYTIFGFCDVLSNVMVSSDSFEIQYKRIEADSTEMGLN